MTWEELERACEGCTGCELYRTKNKTVLGCGNRQAELMFVGEAPGEQEDAAGIPFVGKAGQLFDRYLTAVDIDRDALQVLEEKSLPNVIPLCGDIAKLPPETPYDAMVFCFFGDIEEVLELAAAQCRGDVFIISRNYDTHRFSPGSHPTGSYGFCHAKKTLEQRGIPFQARELEVEFGQPFCSWEDARRFFALYSREQDKTLITDEFLAGKLVKGKGDVPWYLPSLRKLGFIHLHVEDIL